MPRGSTLVWFVPSLALHLVLLFLLLSQPPEQVRRDVPIPEWALVLLPPAAAEPERAPLARPAAPPVAALRRPAPARVADRPVPIVRAPEVADLRLLTPSVTPGVPGGAPTAGEVGTGPRRTAAERLRPEVRDPRLWRPLPAEIVALSPAQIEQFELDLAVGEIADSISALAAAGRRATDWTYTDAQGRRWGIAPGSNGMVNLHLGSITIPIPFGFNAPRTAENLRRASQDAEIAAQAGRTEAASVNRDRAAEIRRRRDAERARARAGERSDTLGGV